MEISAIQLFFQQRRFDLIFKYLYATNPSQYNLKAYLENIRAFNNFHEEHPSDGIAKEEPNDFVKSFDILIEKIKETGYDKKLPPIPIGENGEITDGAHRLAICSALGINVVTSKKKGNFIWDYRFFRENGMNEEIMDFGALEYTKINPNVYIVNILPVANQEKDFEVERILEKYGFIYYCKKIWLTYNGLVNIKRLQYGGPWENAAWIGQPDNKYAGAQEHARHSMGRNPMRIYVFVCPDCNKVRQAKTEIRNVFQIGNYSIHINDTHEEAVQLAETYFNANSLQLLNTRPFHLFDNDFINTIELFKQTCLHDSISLNNVIAVGSTPMNAYGIRHSGDFDFLCSGDKKMKEKYNLSPNDEQSHFYPYSIANMVGNPNLFFFYHGVKFITLDVLLEMKTKRNKYPKDFNDCSKIKKILRYNRHCLMVQKYFNHYRIPLLLRGQSYCTFLIYKTFQHHWIYYMLKDKTTSVLSLSHKK